MDASNRFQHAFHKLQSRLAPVSLPDPQPGLYHFVKSSLGEKSKIHLRLEADGHGLLLVNANRVVHLNPTAAHMAYYILNESPVEAVVHKITSLYRVPSRQARADFQAVSSQVGELIRPDGACPVHELELEVTAPFSARPSAPYRMDLALTYRCNNDCAHCYNARPRSYPELDTSQWKRVIDLLWETGIPHLVFTGGEPTLRDDLPELVAYAQDKGQITGLNTNGRRLRDKSFINRLVEAGLDHVQITVESHLPEIHDEMVQLRGAWDQTIAGLRNALDTPLYVMTNTTMLRDNSPHFEGTLEFLAEVGVPTIGLNALIHSGKGATVDSGLAEADLPALLNLARERISANHQRLIWYTPTQYCNFDPVQLALGVKGCTAALYNMCIEPNGDVIPCQSYYHSLGNILTHPWEKIWGHSTSIKLRERHSLPAKCSSCALVTECGGGCPLLFEPPDPDGVL